MANVEVPRSASIEYQFVGLYEGDTIRITLFTGHASDGYKSDFTRRPARWLVWERLTTNGKRIKRMATRYGGKRCGLGPAEYTKVLTQLQAAGVVEQFSPARATRP